MTNDAPARMGRIRSATIDRRCAKLVRSVLRLDLTVV